MCMFFLFINGHVAELCPVQTILHRLHLLLLTSSPDGRAMATSNALESLFISLFSAPYGLPRVSCCFGGAIEHNRRCFKRSSSPAIISACADVWDSSIFLCKTSNIAQGSCGITDATGICCCGAYCQKGLIDSRGIGHCSN
jgi:hypothetical protein